MDNVARVELVVACYREDCAWVSNIPRCIAATIYDKGGDRAHLRSTSLPSTQLPNIGREAHTYLFHLVERYDSLSPLTVFCQGKPFDHAYDFHASLRGLLTRPQPDGGFQWLGHLIDWDDCRGQRLFVPWSKNLDRRELNVRSFHRLLFGEDGPEFFSFFGGAQFAVTAELVRSRPRSFYERALDLSESFPDAAHCLERMWDRVFGVEGVPEEFRGKTVHLKPIKARRDATVNLPVEAVEARRVSGAATISG